MASTVYHLCSLNFFSELTAYSQNVPPGILFSKVSVQFWQTNTGKITKLKTAKFNVFFQIIFAYYTKAEQFSFYKLVCFYFHLVFIKNLIVVLISQYSKTNIWTLNSKMSSEFKCLSSQ